MTADIVWSIENTEYATDTGAVVTAHWRVTATDGDLVTSSYGSVGFSPDPDDPDFVPLEDLSEEVVLGWVKGQLDVAAIESGLLGNLATLADPPTAIGLPWV